MALPTSRTEFKDYCLRKLGFPVIEINVEDMQVEDRIDESFSYYWDYHFDGVERDFYKKSITQDDIDNQYLTIPDNIIGAVRIFDIGNNLSTNNLFNIKSSVYLSSNGKDDHLNIKFEDPIYLNECKEKLIKYFTNLKIDNKYCGTHTEIPFHILIIISKTNIILLCEIVYLHFLSHVRYVL
mgnify:CR=1 FL=1